MDENNNKPIKFFEKTKNFQKNFLKEKIKQNYLPIKKESIEIKESKEENKIITGTGLELEKEKENLNRNKNKNLTIKNPEDNFAIENLFSFSYKNNLSYTESLVNIRILKYKDIRIKIK